MMQQALQYHGDIHPLHCSKTSKVCHHMCSMNLSDATFLPVVERMKTDSNKDYNKKHPENADTSTSVTFDLDVWPWPYIKVKKAYVIRCCLLYCTLVSGMMSVSKIVCKYNRYFIFCDLWPSPVTFGIKVKNADSCYVIPAYQGMGLFHVSMITVCC